MILNDAFGSFAPEAFSFNKDSMRGIKEQQQDEQALFSADIQFLAQNHGPDSEDRLQQYVACELCGQPTLQADVDMAHIDADLCPCCFEHWRMMPEGNIKESLSRHLIGNVI